MVGLLLVSVVLLIAVTCLYWARTRHVPTLFMLSAAVVLLLASLVEAFGEQAGANIGSSSLIAVVGVLVVGCVVVQPVWRLCLAAIVCLLESVAASIAYLVATVYFDDVRTRLDESPTLLVPLAAVAVTVAAVLASDLPAPPRRLLGGAVLILLAFPVTRIGDAAKPVGEYLVYAAATLFCCGWLWLIYQMRGMRSAPGSRPHETDDIRRPSRGDPLP